MVARNALAGAAASVVAFALTALVYQGHRDAFVDFERGYEDAFVEEFHPRERAGDTYFRWTTESSYLVFEHLPKAGEITVETRLKVIRPASEPLPELAFTANGVTVHRAPASPGTGSYRFDFPSTGSRLRLGIESDTFEAAGSRELGVQALSVRVELPDRSPAWIGPSAWMALASVLLFAAARAAGLSSLVAGTSALVLSLGFLHLLSQNALRFTAYPRRVAFLAALALVVALLGRVLLARLAWLHPRERSLAIGTIVLVLLVKLALVTYPLMLSSDAFFQANRMSELLQGNWHPTSVTQHEPPFRIPYPAALYVVAAPLAKLGLSQVAALEMVTAFFDTVVSAVLLYLAWRFLDDLRAGIAAALLYALVPMNPLAFSAGNFTNLFAVSMLTLAATFLAVAGAAGDRRAALLCGVSTLLALTAHFGMLLEGVLLWPLWLCLLWLSPAPVRDERRLLTLAVATSFLAAALYYLGYAELFTSQWQRAFEREYASGGVSGPAEKLSFNLALMGEQLGWIFLLASILGSLPLVRRPLEGSFRAMAAAWLGVTLVFFAVDLLTAIEIRYWLQALPLLALFAGVYLSRAFDRGAVGKIASVAAMAYIGYRGVTTLYAAALFRYH